MKRLRIAALIFGVMLLTVFFHSIYVCSVRNQMMTEVTALTDQIPSEEAFEDILQTWKNRKGWLVLSTPLAVLDQIDLQLAEMQAGIQTKDDSGYVCACRRLLTLLSNLGR